MGDWWFVWMAVQGFALLLCVLQFVCDLINMGRRPRRSHEERVDVFPIGALRCANSYRPIDQFKWLGSHLRQRT